MNKIRQALADFGEMFFSLPDNTFLMIVKVLALFEIGAGVIYLVVIGLSVVAGW